MTITLKKGIGNTEELKIMVDWLNDPEVVRYSEQRHKQHDIDSQLHYILNEPDIFRTIWTDNKLIGTIAAYVDTNNSVADVGILIGDKSVWGKGYGTKAWMMFCDSLFETGIRKIEAGCMSINLGMLKIFEKYEMLYEGSRSDHFKVHIGACNLSMWGKFRG